MYENVFCVDTEGVKAVCDCSVGLKVKTASELPIVSVNSHASSVMPGGSRRVADASFTGRSYSEELVCTRHISAVYFSYFLRLIISYLTVCPPLQTFE